MLMCSLRGCRTNNVTKVVPYQKLCSMVDSWDGHKIVTLEEANVYGVV